MSASDLPPLDAADTSDHLPKLTFVDGPDKLRKVLEAGASLLDGDDAPAKALVEESRAAAG